MSLLVAALKKLSKNHKVALPILTRTLEVRFFIVTLEES